MLRRVSLKMYPSIITHSAAIDQSTTPCRQHNDVRPPVHLVKNTIGSVCRGIASLGSPGDDITRLLAEHRSPIEPYTPH